MSQPDPTALRAIRAWVRLEQAREAFNAELRRRHRITGDQLAILRIVDELAPIRLRDLRRRLVLHPATLGQLLDRLARKGLLELRADPADARVRVARATRKGRALLARAPLAGPVRLRSAAVDGERLTRFADALEDAIDLFGFQAAPSGGRSKA